MSKFVYAHLPIAAGKLHCRDCLHATRFRPDRRPCYCAKAAEMAGVEPSEATMGQIGPWQNACKYWEAKRP